MDPENLSESEEEDDDEMMLLILPALYLASAGYEAKRTRFTVAQNGYAKFLKMTEARAIRNFELSLMFSVHFHSMLGQNIFCATQEAFLWKSKSACLCTCSHEMPNFDQLSDRFERSRETIHRHIKACFDAVVSLKGDFVKRPGSETHWKILSDPHYGPYFENCIGAIDGIHVPLTSIR